MNEFEMKISEYGLDFVSSTAAKEVLRRIHSYSDALQFVLEELDAARHGNKIAISFVNNSGFNPEDYISAMDRSYDAIDGAEGPQQFLNTISFMIEDIELMSKFKVTTVDKVMQHWKLGKYKS
ncbi:2-oxo acid dehydrogenase subunit E2 [Candidatus Thioglobus sp.]|nr:2-oxo acid dehydrogenase subunit E2 [Candidatus Thioglobus sp.]